MRRAGGPPLVQEDEEPAEENLRAQPEEMQPQHVTNTEAKHEVDNNERADNDWASTPWSTSWGTTSEGWAASWTSSAETLEWNNTTSWHHDDAWDGVATWAPRVEEEHLSLSEEDTSWSCTWSSTSSTTSTTSTSPSPRKMRRMPTTSTSTRAHSASKWVTSCTTMCGSDLYRSRMLAATIEH